MLCQCSAAEFPSASWSSQLKQTRQVPKEKINICQPPPHYGIQALSPVRITERILQVYKHINCVCEITATIAPGEAPCILLAWFLSVIIKGKSEVCANFRNAETRYRLTILMVLLPSTFLGRYPPLPVISVQLLTRPRTDWIEEDPKSCFYLRVQTQFLVYTVR